MPYEYSEAQKRYLRKKFAKEKEEEKGCDCSGCEKCIGFVRGCTCDLDLEWLSSRYEERKRGGMADQGSVQSLPDRTAPAHVNHQAFEEYGF